MRRTAGEGKVVLINSDTLVGKTGEEGMVFCATIYVTGKHRRREGGKITSTSNSITFTRRLVVHSARHKANSFDPSVSPTTKSVDPSEWPAPTI
jgi:hypothetical protein